MKTPRNTIKVKWLRKEVSGTGWQPGIYSFSKFAENSAKTLRILVVQMEFFLSLHNTKFLMNSEYKDSSVIISHNLIKPVIIFFYPV
jgi:hypothetical protein